jgi:hypothetical protein
MDAKAPDILVERHDAEASRQRRQRLAGLSPLGETVCRARIGGVQPRKQLPIWRGHCSMNNVFAKAAARGLEMIGIFPCFGLSPY